MMWLRLQGRLPNDKFEREGNTMLKQCFLDRVARVAPAMISPQLSGNCLPKDNQEFLFVSLQTHNGVAI